MKSDKFPVALHNKKKWAQEEMKQKSQFWNDAWNPGTYLAIPSLPSVTDFSASTSSLEASESHDERLFLKHVNVLLCNMNLLEKSTLLVNTVIQ